MAQKLGVYKCEICGNIVEVLHSGQGELVCCGQNMTLLEEKTEDSAVEKHVPFIEKIDQGIKVKVGQNAAHPMVEEHYIEWIEVNVDGKVCIKFLNPGDNPEAVFKIDEDKVTAREYCNVHGLWKS